MMFRAVAMRPSRVQPAPRALPTARVLHRVAQRNFVAQPRLRNPAGVDLPSWRLAAVSGTARKAPLQPDPILPDSLFDVDTRIQTLPGDIVGPITITSTPEGTRGVYATRNLTSGELLWVGRPLALVRAAEAYPDDYFEVPEAAEGEEPVMPEYDQTLPFTLLADRLMEKRYSARELGWLAALRTDGDYTNNVQEVAEGEEEPPRAPPAPLLPVDLAALQLLDDEDKSLPIPASFTRERAIDLVQMNAFLAISDDPALCVLSETDGGVNVLSISPQVAFLNHSCAPNTVSYPIGNTIVTRATRPGIARGAELTRSLLPNLVTAPLLVRREYLQSTYGFKCNCHRCLAEDGVAPAFSELVTEIFKACDEMKEELEAAVSGGDGETIGAAKDQLVQYVTTFDAALEKYTLPEQTMIWIKAGLFDMYEMLLSCMSAEGTQEPRLTALLSGLMGAVYPGSDGHQFWTYQHLRNVQEVACQQAAQEQQVDIDSDSVMAAARRTSEFKAADQLCFKASCARYGRITPPVYRRILDALRTLEVQNQQEEEEEYEEGEQEGGEFAEDGEEGEGQAGAEDGEFEEEGEEGEEEAAVDVQSEDVPKPAARA